MEAHTAILFLCLLPTAHGIQCHHCKGVTDPHYCVEMVVCGQNEECYSDLVVGDFENVFYNSGCRNKNICKLLLENPSRRNQLAACEECCGTDGCNTGLCLKHENKTKTDCYECDNVTDPGECHNRITCADDEMCITEDYLDENYKEKFKMGCEKKSDIDDTETHEGDNNNITNSLCDDIGFQLLKEDNWHFFVWRCNTLKQLGRREVTTCIDCCSTSGCNRHLC